MIDRGDLAAEVGDEKLTDYTENIISDCKKKNKPIIIATENLNSLIHNPSPSKSDILNLDYFISKNVDYLMLSDETATSKNWRSTLNWLKNYLNKKRTKVISEKIIDISQVLKNFSNQNLVIFSKKGYFYRKFKIENLSRLVLFTENKHLSKIANLKENIDSFYSKFPKKNIDSFLFNKIKEKKDFIFRKNKTAFLINVTFPRKNSRANTFIIINKKDFI